MGRTAAQKSKTHACTHRQAKRGWFFQEKLFHVKEFIISLLTVMVKKMALQAWNLSSYRHFAAHDLWMVLPEIILQDYSAAVLTDKWRKFYWITGRSRTGPETSRGVFWLKYVTVYGSAVNTDCAQLAIIDSAFRARYKSRDVCPWILLGFASGAYSEIPLSFPPFPSPHPHLLGCRMNCADCFFFWHLIAVSPFWILRRLFKEKRCFLKEQYLVCCLSASLLYGVLKPCR